MQRFTIYLFLKTFYMFQTVFPSIIRSSKLHIQRQVFVRPAASREAPDDGRKNRLKHVERLTEINKLWNVASCWLYSANIGLKIHYIEKWRWERAVNILKAQSCLQVKLKIENLCLELNIDSITLFTITFQQHIPAFRYIFDNVVFHSYILCSKLI